MWDLKVGKDGYGSGWFGLVSFGLVWVVRT